MPMVRRVKTGVNVGVGRVQQVPAIERIGHIDGKRGVTVGRRKIARGNNDRLRALEDGEALLPLGRDDDAARAARDAGSARPTRTRSAAAGTS